MAESAEKVRLEQEERWLRRKLAVCRLLEQKPELFQDMLEKNVQTQEKCRENLEDLRRKIRRERWRNRLPRLVITLFLVAVASFYTAIFTNRDFMVRVLCTMEPIFATPPVTIVHQDLTMRPNGWSWVNYPSYIPEGFYLNCQMRYDEAQLYTLVYRDMDGKTITFSQSVYSEGMSVDNENGEETFYDLPGYSTARLFYKRNGYYMTLSDGELIFTLYAPGYLGEEEVLKIAKSIQMFE